MEVTVNGAAPTDVVRYDPVGRCIYCDATESSDGSPLSEEHIIPRGMGGRLILPSASCDACRDTTSLFELRFQREMYAATRAYWNLYDRQKAGRPTVFDVYFNDRTQRQSVPLDEYPYLLQMPLLDSPGMLAGRPVNPREFPNLLESERLWTWAAPEAEERAQALLEKYGTASIAATQRIYLTDFFKLIAKIAHGFCIATKGYSPHVHYLLRGLIKAPDGCVTDGATYLVGAAAKPDGTPVRAAAPEKIYDLSQLVYTRPNLMEQIIAVRVQLFAMLGSPIYEAVVYPWPPILRQQS